MFHKAIALYRFLVTFFSQWSIVNTIVFNFKVFPFKQALRFPVKIGKRVTMKGLHKGCVIMDSMETFISELVTCRYPMYANKGQHTLIRISKGSRLILGKNVRISSGSSIVISRGGVLTIGDNVLTNQQVVLYCIRKVFIGACTSIGWQTQIYDTDFHFIYRKSKRVIANNISEVKIGKGCWIPNRITISKGAHLPDYSVVAAGSLVNKNFSDIKEIGAFFAGCPASYKGVAGLRIINEQKQAELYDYFKESETPLMYCDDEYYWYNDRYGKRNIKTGNGGDFVQPIQSSRLCITKCAA